LSRKPIVFMYSGQGSQYYQMGADLYLENTRFKTHVDTLDETAAGVVGLSLRDVIFDSDKGVSDVFNDVILSGLSIYMMERALTRTLIDYGVTPDCVLGSSMGMFAASVQAECISEEDGFRYIYEQGKIVKATCRTGYMIAILERVDVYEESSVLRAQSEIASVNYDASFVISLPTENLGNVEEDLKRRRITYQVMGVEHAYHSHWMDAAKNGYLGLYEFFGNRKPSIPVVCCAKAEELSCINEGVLWNSMRNILRLQDSIIYLEKSGPYRYIDVGPSGTLATSLKYGLPAGSASQVSFILSPYRRTSSRLGDLLNQLFSETN